MKKSAMTVLGSYKSLLWTDVNVQPLHCTFVRRRGDRDEDAAWGKA